MKRAGRSKREPLDLGELLRIGETHKPFVVASPKMVALLQSLLRPLS